MQAFLDGRVIAKTGDITREEVDVIVNAANPSLMGGGGVDGAIHRVGGPVILEECRRIRNEKYPEGLPAGKAVSTMAGRLPAKFVIHTVGPVWHGGAEGEDGLLAAAYRNALIEAQRLGCSSIAFPAVSTGVYGFPPIRAAGVVSRSIEEFLNPGTKPDRIFLIFFSQSDLNIFISNQKFSH